MRINRIVGLVGLVILAASLQAVSRENNPAESPVPQGGWADKRHADKLALEKSHKYDLLMIGDSITHNFEKPEYQPIWNQYFAPRNALDLGYSGARTENILWNIEHGELDGQAPKVVTLMIGTNNADETNYPTHHTGHQIYGGIRAIVHLIREKLPKTKIILLRCFPYGAQPDLNSRGFVLNMASALSQTLADNRNVFWCDINHVFLNADGSMNKELMPDVLHPSPEGARRWAEAMEPLLSRLMGDKSR
jgi:lysophospholipase L1-like esterase